MLQSQLDYTSFFHLLSQLPEGVEPLKACFYVQSTAELDQQWQGWLQRWHAEIAKAGDPSAVRNTMQQANPAITWREWLIAPAYQQASEGNNTLVHELQALFNTPYQEPEAELKAHYDRLRPREYFSAGGISHYSCSS